MKVINPLSIAYFRATAAGSYYTLNRDGSVYDNPMLHFTGKQTNEGEFIVQFWVDDMVQSVLNFSKFLTLHGVPYKTERLQDEVVTFIINKPHYKIVL